MVRILGGNPVVGILLAAVLLTIGLGTHRPLLAVAAGFVGIASMARLASRSRDDTGSRP